MNGALCLSITGFFLLFQFCENFIGTHALGKQLFQNGLCFCLFCFFRSFGICLCFLCFQSGHFFFGFLQSSLLLFQISLQSVNVCGDGCNLSRECFLFGLLLCNLRCKISSYSFGLILATFGTGHRGHLHQIHIALM